MKTWSEAFAAQALSDLQTYDHLSRSTVPASHRLSYLQMWLEKLCEAYLWSPGAPPIASKASHNVIADVLPKLIGEHWRRIGFAHRPDRREIWNLCREIDLLHPQVDDNNRRPDNVEYPWLGISEEVNVPAHWEFSLASMLYSNHGKLLLKAADRLTRRPAVFIPRK
jgi:hypothetical protein